MSEPVPEWDGPPKVTLVFILEQDVAVRVRAKNADDVERLRQWISRYTPNLSKFIDDGLLETAKRKREGR